MSTTLGVRQRAWADKPKFAVRSRQGSTLLLRRTGSTIGSTFDQREAIRSLHLPRVGSYCLISEDDGSQLGYFEAASHIVKAVARICLPLPYGDFNLVSFGTHLRLFLGDCGMSDLEVVAHPESGDVSFEAEDGGFLQWHVEEKLNSVWWSCRDISLPDVLKVVSHAFGKFDDRRVSAAVMLFGSGTGPLILDAVAALEQAQRDPAAVEFIVFDYDHLSFSWTNAGSTGLERGGSDYGEASVVFEGDYDRAVADAIRSTATKSLGQHTTDIFGQFRGMDV